MKLFLHIFLSTSVIVCTFSYSNSQNQVDIHGQLVVSGNHILDSHSQVISFAGNSLFWSNAGWGGEKYYNQDVVNWLKEDWNSSIIRAAMGVDEDGGYLSNKTREKEKVKTIIEACIDQGLYVIVDWHSHHAEDYTSDAVEFFEEIATEYGHEPNIIYEIYNEPLQVSWTSVIKPYAETVIGAIRAIDSDNLIVVGTPTWSQDVDVASNDPITDYDNIAYTLHFYAATHKAYLREKADVALENGIALFVTEWGSCEASGNGPVDETSTGLWMDFLRQNSISNCNWALNDKAESASSLKSGASTSGEWLLDNLTQSGKLVKNIIKNWEEVSITTGSDVLVTKHDSLYFCPNPVTSIINIRKSSSQEVTIKVKDMKGRTVLTKSKVLIDGSVNLNISALENGAYILEVQQGEEIIQRRFLKE